MKKIFNRVLAAAIAVPMALTQSVVMNVSAEDTGAKVLTLDTFTAIPYDQTESNWNEAALNMVLSMEGTQKEITAADFINLIPQTNMYGVMLAELLADAPNPVLTVESGVVKVSGSADLSAYAEEKIYSKVNAAAGAELNMTAFNKTVEYSLTVDANVLASGKTVEAMPVVTIDGTEIDETNASDYFKGLTDDLAAEVSAQVGIDASIEEAMAVEIIDKIEKAESWFDRAEALERTGSYATADEMMAAISKFVDNRVNVYDFPASVDEAVARHGNGFNAAIDLVSGISASSGYVLDITADDVAELAKSGSNFEVAVSGGTYEVSFNIPDAEAAEVEAWVNENAEPDENGTVMVYESSTKLVEASLTTDGVVFFNVTREIELIDSKLTTTTTTTTTTDDSSTTTTTTTTDDSSTTTTTTTSDTDTDTDTDTTTTTSDTTTDSDTTTTTSDTTTDSDTTTTTSDTTTDSDTTTTTSDTTTSSGSTDTTTSTSTLPLDFELEDIEVEGGVGYYFSHDENAFDLSTLITSLTLIGNVNGEERIIPIAVTNFADYLTPAYATPADYFNSIDGTAYVADALKFTFNTSAVEKIAATADLTIADEECPTVYIGVKGDTNLNGVVEIADATMILTYYSNSAVAMNPSLNDNAELEVLAYFLADIDTESTEGADTDLAKMEIADATNILKYYSQDAASLNPSWDEILGR